MPLTRARLRISDYNDNRKARLKSQERRIIMVSLSLTSMVDMFAILVIFLLSNATTVAQWVEVSHGIDLPKAKFSDPPPRGASIQISRDAIFGDTKILTSLSRLDSIEGAVRGWLAKQPKRKGAGGSGYVNIVAHQKVPYGAVKRVIAACQDAGFKNVNLAVQPKN